MRGLPIKKSFFILMLISALTLQVTCLRGRSPVPGGGAEQRSIQNTGSDTIVNLAQAWAEIYATVNPAVSIEVSGGGTGTGVAALINGTVDIANCSRKLEPIEIEKAIKNTGKEPIEFLVGYDALAIYVHKDNPLDSLTLQQLAEIYGEKGELKHWSDLGVNLPSQKRDEIIVVSRQSNSGTYHYFREAVLGKKRDFKLGTIDMHGSKDVVELIGRTINAIGFSGMGYATHEVKMLRIAKKQELKAYPPSIATTLDGTYPIARPLFMYTLGVPTGAVQDYLNWITTDGQAYVQTAGYVPLTAFHHEDSGAEDRHK